MCTCCDLVPCFLFSSMSVLYSGTNICIHDTLCNDIACFFLRDADCTPTALDMWCFCKPTSFCLVVHHPLISDGIGLVRTTCILVIRIADMISSIDRVGKITSRLPCTDPYISNTFQSHLENTWMANDIDEIEHNDIVGKRTSNSLRILVDPVAITDSANTKRLA